MKPVSDLPNDLRSYLHECCDETGHGSFRVTSRRTGGLVQLALEATPSQRYRDSGNTLADLVPTGRSGERRLRSARSLDEVSDRIITRLIEIWEQASGNGSVEVGCRRQHNGKVRIRIRHSFDDEVVLRPEEIQVALPEKPQLTK